MPFWAFAAALVLLITPLPGAPRALSTPHFMVCQIGERLVGHCGTLEVYENRQARTGRILSLAVTEIDAIHRSDRAIFWNPGGPGGADSKYVPFIASGKFARELDKLHSTYDLVFVDNRGTGDSGAMECRNFYSAHHPERFFAQLYPDAEVRTCRDTLSKFADLNMYTTDFSADDLDDVRKALHYPKIVLDGVSYGTTFFLDYARRYPRHVESMVLSGVAPPGIMLIPLEDAGGAQTAIRALIADCRRDVRCSQHYPHFGADFAVVARRFNAGPIKVLARNYFTSRQQVVLLSKETFADQLRATLYRSDRAAYVPFVIDRARRGDYEPIAELVEVAARHNSEATAMGLNLSILCAEDVPFISTSQIARSSAGTFEGATRVRAEQQACKIWNVRPVSTSFLRPVRSFAPILMISGSDDPATPASYGRQALSYLPNGRQLVIPNTTHDISSTCVVDVIVSFILVHNDGQTKTSSCHGSFGHVPFANSMKGFEN